MKFSTISQSVKRIISLYIWLSHSHVLINKRINLKASMKLRLRHQKRLMKKLSSKTRKSLRIQLRISLNIKLLTNQKSRKNLIGSPQVVKLLRSLILLITKVKWYTTTQSLSMSHQHMSQALHRSLNTTSSQ